LKKSYLARFTLPKALVLDFHSHAPLANAAFLSCGDQSVGVYSGAGPLWTEVRLSDSSVRQWRIKPLASVRMSGLALMAGNTVYASFNNQRASMASRGLYLLDLGQPGTATWMPVPGTVSNQAAKSFAVLVGRDGLNMVYLRSAVADPAGNPVLHWSKP